MSKFQKLYAASAVKSTTISEQDAKNANENAKDALEIRIKIDSKKLRELNAGIDKSVKASISDEDWIDGMVKSKIDIAQIEAVIKISQELLKEYFGDDQ